MVQQVRLIPPICQTINCLHLALNFQGFPNRSQITQQSNQVRILQVEILTIKKDHLRGHSERLSLLAAVEIIPRLWIITNLVTSEILLQELNWTVEEWPNKYKRKRMEIKDYKIDNSSKKIIIDSFRRGMIRDPLP